jgi:beta-lactam-binding protein with PASTA domain
MGDAEKVCPYCQQPVSPGKSAIACPTCGVSHHVQCWQANHGCTTFGCGRAAIAQATDNASPEAAQEIGAFPTARAEGLAKGGDGGPAGPASVSSLPAGPTFSERAAAAGKVLAEAWAAAWMGIRRLATRAAGVVKQACGYLSRGPIQARAEPLSRPQTGDSAMAHEAGPEPSGRGFGLPRLSAGLRAALARVMVPLAILGAIGGVLVWSTGYVRVPDLTQLSQVAAPTRVPPSLRIKVEGEEYGTASRGVVLRQAPPAGARARKGSAIRIWISSGPLCTVPDVVGEPSASAMGRLEAIHVRGMVASVSSGGGSAPGRVVSQSPAGGSRVAPGTTVVLTVSSDASEIRVPSAVGQPLEVARRVFEAAGLSCSTAGSRFDASRSAGCVVSQDPVPGAKSRPGCVVRVITSMGQGIKVPRLAGLKEGAARSALREAGLGVAVVHRTDDGAPAGHVIRSTPRAGSHVAPGSRITLVISSGPGRPLPDYGTLVVSTEPTSCQVWLYVDGGNTRGECPQTIRVSPGRHYVILWDTTHRVPLRLTVNVERGAVLKVHRRVH